MAERKFNVFYSVSNSGFSPVPDRVHPDSPMTYGDALEILKSLDNLGWPATVQDTASLKEIDPKTYEGASAQTTDRDFFDTDTLAAVLV